MGSISTSQINASQIKQARVRVTKKIHNSNAQMDGLRKTEPMRFEIEEIQNRRLFYLDHDDIPADFNFEWTVCLEVKPNPYLTSCCVLLICSDCKSKVTKCPQRCSNKTVEFVKSKAVDEKLEETRQKCEYCLQKVYDLDSTTHYEECSKDFYPTSIVEKSLHSWKLNKLDFPSGRKWTCALRRDQGENHLDRWKTELYGCRKCSMYVCKLWVLNSIHLSAKAQKMCSVQRSHTQNDHLFKRFSPEYFRRPNENNISGEKKWEVVTKDKQIPIGRLHRLSFNNY